MAMQCVSTSSPPALSHAEICGSQQFAPIRATGACIDIDPESQPLKKKHAAIEDAWSQYVAESDCAVAIARAYSKDHTWVLVSSPMEELTGYNRDELLGKNLRLLVQNCDEDMEGNSILNEAFSSDCPCSIMRTCRRKTGELYCIKVLVLTLAAPQFVDSADYSLKLFILHDITDNVIHPFNTASQLRLVSEALPCMLTKTASVDKDKDNHCHPDFMKQAGFWKNVERFPPGDGIAHKAAVLTRGMRCSEQACTRITVEQTPIDICIMATGVVVGICLGLLKSMRRHH